MRILLLIFLMNVVWLAGNAQSQNYDLRNWPKGSSPTEIGNRIVERFLKTSNSQYIEVCQGINIKNSREHYMTRKRIVGDLHGQAPVL